MTLRNVLLVFLLLTISQNIWASDTLSKYIVIDTIVFEKDVDFKRLQKDDHLIKLLIAGHDVTIEKNEISNNDLNILSKVYFTRKDSLSIDITIDDKGSTVHFNNLEKLGDTIHINTWTVFHNDLPDTVTQFISHFHHIDDSTIKTYKHRESISYSGSDTNMRKSFSFTLNGVFRCISLTTQKGSNMSIGCGPSTKRDWKKYAKNIENKHFHFNKYNSLSGGFVEKILLYHGYLQL